MNVKLVGPNPYDWSYDLLKGWRVCRGFGRNHIVCVALAIS